jgi:polar amino acid transport system permease protein
VASVDQSGKTRIEVTDSVLIPARSEKGIFTAWHITFIGAILILIALPLFKPDPFLDIYKFLPDGILNTFLVTVLSIIFAILIGFITGLGRLSRNVFINGIANVYVELIRGIPLLVQLFYIYFAIGYFIKLPRLTAAVIALAICYGAYMGEIFRAGIASISKGQMEAALSLGFSRGQAIRKIIIPQTIRVILPPIGNEFIALLKDSSLVSIIAVTDLLRRGREFASTTFTYFETLTVVALVYLVMTLLLSRVVAILEERLHHAGKR